MRNPYVIYGALNSLNILFPQVTLVANSSHFEAAFPVIHVNLDFSSLLACTTLKFPPPLSGISFK